MKFLFDSVAGGSCLLNLDADDMHGIIAASVDFLIQTGRLGEQHRDRVVDGLMERERRVPTVIGHACAVPHYYDDAIETPALVFVRLKHAVNLGAPDGIATRYVFLMIGDKSQTALHLDSLSSIARLMSDNVFHFEATYAKTQQEVLDAIERHVNRNVLALPPKPRLVTEGLTTSWRPGSGLKADILRRFPSYLDDFKSGFQGKSIASVVFMFFACLAPAVTFGGFMGSETGGAIGAPQMLIATAVCGIAYALLAGSPLIILGGIGPLLIFTIILYRLCGDIGLADHFLGVYGWVGLWTGLMTFGLATTNASNLMKYFTRFTDEIFSALMSLIFIYKAVQALAGEFGDGAGQGGYERALLALVLAVGTFYIAMTLARFRSSKYLFPWIREFLADFGPSIALGAMIPVAWWLGDSATLETLSISGGQSLRTGWIVDLWSVPRWAIFAAAGPAILASVLVFLSQNITARLVNNKENKLTKGEAYHLDLAVVGVLIAVSSLFGWPWMVAATVRSLAHLRALAVFEDVVDDGQSRESIVHVMENRVTGLAIHGLIGGTLLALPLLEYIPMATLYGIFLFMGFSSLRGLQFMDRIGFLLMNSKLYPINHYTRRVPTKTIHLFTLVQVVCLVVLCIINLAPSETLRILFPVFIAMLVPVRFLLNRFFDTTHLAFLDADEGPEEESMYRD